MSPTSAVTSRFLGGPFDGHTAKLWPRSTGDVLAFGVGHQVAGGCTVLSPHITVPRLYPPVNKPQHRYSVAAAADGQVLRYLGVA